MFISNGAAKVLSSESMSTIRELSLLLNNFGSTVLNFLGDSLTSIIYHKEKNINNLLGVSATTSVEGEFEQ